MGNGLLDMQLAALEQNTQGGRGIKCTSLNYRTTTKGDIGVEDQLVLHGDFEI